MGEDPRTGEFVDGGAAAQARQLRMNVLATLAAIGTAETDVVVA